MSEAPPRSGRGVEVEVGGSGILIASLVVLGLCAVSFWIGRWSVQAVGPATGARAPGEAASMEDGGNLDEDLTFFDRLERAPELSAQGEERTVTPPAEPARPASPAGPFAVQVLASAERATAEAVLAKLLRREYDARLVIGEKEGRPLYRVRVVGYADEAAAEAAARQIEKQEGLRTWVTR
ncbi:MAG: SPOR domain-containing protein [Acidobacteriota bacterium]|jgi:hypothetical protein